MLRISSKKAENVPIIKIDAAHNLPEVIDVREHFYQGHQGPFLDRRQAETDTDILC